MWVPCRPGRELALSAVHNGRLRDYLNGFCRTPLRRRLRYRLGTAHYDFGRNFARATLGGEGVGFPFAFLFGQNDDVEIDSFRHIRTA